MKNLPLFSQPHVVPNLYSVPYNNTVVIIWLAVIQKWVFSGRRGNPR